MLPNKDIAIGALVIFLNFIRYILGTLEKLPSMRYLNLSLQILYKYNQVTSLFNEGFL